MNRKVALALIIVGCIILAGSIMLATGTIHIWEDGSWAIGNFPYILHGCLPGGLCNL